MSKKHRITILLHQRDVYPNTRRHLIWRIAAWWQKGGIDVTIVKGVPGVLNEREFLLPHIDLTLVPPEYQRFIQSAPRALNQQMNDISKRLISRNLVKATDVFEGPVIVKTNANCGGYPEFVSASISGKISSLVQSMVKWPGRDRIAPGKYPVYPSMHYVPEQVWNNPSLVVEKFIPEREGDYYCNRVCFFLGDVVLNRRVYSKSKIIKGNVIEHSESATVPQEIYRIREEMGFQYGKLDYVVHAGIVHVLDVNKTPGVVGDNAINERIAEKLARGIDKYL